MSDRKTLAQQLMAAFDDLPAGLREAINYAPEPLDPKQLRALCRRHGWTNVLAMIERKRAEAAAPENSGKTGGERR